MDEPTTRPHRIGDACPRCGEILDGRSLNGAACLDCEEELSCHFCQWPDAIPEG